MLFILEIGHKRKLSSLNSHRHKSKLIAEKLNAQGTYYILCKRFWQYFYIDTYHFYSTILINVNKKNTVIKKK